MTGAWVRKLRAVPEYRNSADFRAPGAPSGLVHVAQIFWLSPGHQGKP